MKKFTLTVGLFLALSTSFLRAQTQEITSYLPDDGEDYRGYCIERTNFDDVGAGYLAAGSRTEGGRDHHTIHLLCISSDKPTNTTGSILKFPDYDDVRAIALTMLKPGVASMLVQARKTNGEVHPVIVLIDCATAGSPHVIEQLQMSGEGQFPTSMCLSPDGKALYVAGFITSGSFNPSADMKSSKEAFAARLDLGSHAVTLRRFNTPRVSGTDNDYDMIQRIRFIKDYLYVIGSNNDTKSGYTTSKVWVAQVDASTLSILKESHFGNDAFSPQGFQGVDMVPDVKYPGNFYVVGNDYYWHTWTLSRIDPSLQIMPGGTKFKNTVTYAYSADIKGCGVLAQQDARLSVYGNMWANLPAPPNVASFTDGAVPFIASFDPVIDPTYGLQPTNLTWFNEGNLPSTATYLPGRYTPYWINSNLSYWNDPAFTVMADPGSSSSDLAIMGHVGYTGSNLAPRIITSDPNGKVSGCPGSVDVTPDVEPGVVGITLYDIKIGVEESPIKLELNESKGDLQPLPHKAVNCGDDGYYRPAQATGIAAHQVPSIESLSPNPATDAVKLKWNGEVAASDVLSLEITDMAGRSYGKANLQSRSASYGLFSLPQLAPGLYVATFYINGKAGGQHKLSIR